MSESSGLNFVTTEGFVLPDGFDQSALPLVNQVLDSAEQYARAPLLDRRERGKVFGGRITLEGFACGGFVLHTLLPIDETQVGAETYVAPPPDISETDFLRECMAANRKAMPGPDFRRPRFDTIANALAAADTPVAAGMAISVDTYRPQISLHNLFIPRVYFDQFGGTGSKQQIERNVIKLTAGLFFELTAAYLRSDSEG